MDFIKVQATSFLGIAKLVHFYGGMTPNQDWFQCRWSTDCQWPTWKTPATSAYSLESWAGNSVGQLSGPSTGRMLSTEVLELELIVLECSLD